jgi:serine/threonine protein kinase
VIHLGAGRCDGFTVQRELRTYRRLSHPNIVRIAEVLHSKKLSTVWAVLTDAPLYGPLDRFLDISLPEQTLATIFMHVLRAVAYLHTQGLVHQDISLADILLCPPGIAKLSDSAVGHRCDELVEGRPAYTAPETLDQNSDALIDPVKEGVWSIGVCLYAAAYGRLPYVGESGEEVFAEIMAGKLQWPETRSGVLVALLRGMLAVDAGERFGIDEVRSHPFFQAAGEVFTLPVGNVELPPPPSTADIVHITANVCDETHTFLCHQSLSCPQLFQHLGDVKQ